MILKGRHVGGKKGALNSLAKLDNEKVLEIFKSKLSADILASKYKVRKSTIWRIKAGTRWGWLKKV
jgi:hypothetical protein